MVNGRPVELAEGCPVVGAVAGLLPAGAQTRGVAVAVNDAVVPRSQWAGHALRDGDRVEVVTAVQGG